MLSAVLLLKMSSSCSAQRLPRASVLQTSAVPSACFPLWSLELRVPVPRLLCLAWKFLVLINLDEFVGGHLAIEVCSLDLSNKTVSKRKK